MEAVMTVLADEQQALLGAVLLTGMPTHGAGLRSVVCIYLDGHTLIQESFIRNHRVQLSEGPFRLSCVGFPLLLARFLAPFVPRAVSDIGQVLKSNQGMWVSLHNPFTHNMIGVLLEPSLSPTDLYESTGRRASAFLLQTLPQSCIMMGLGDNGFTGMEGTLSFRRARYRQIAHAYVYTHNTRMPLWRRVSHLYLKRYKQVELLAWLVIPQFCTSYLSTMFNQCSMLVGACVGDHYTTLKRQDTDVLLLLKAVVLALLIGQGGRNILGGLIKSFVSLLGQPCLTQGC